MKKLKSNRLRKKNYFIRWRILFVIFLYLFPANYCGKIVHLRNKTNDSNYLDMDNQSQRKPSEQMKIIINNERKSQQMIEPQAIVVVSTNFMTFSILCFFLTNILLFLLLGYLNSVSLEKHGMLLYLYMDIVKICLLINGLWLMAVMSCNLLGNGLTLNEAAAKPISYGFLALGQVLMLVLNVMVILRYRMMKERMLDPPMPWDTSDEETICSMNKVRFFILLLTTFSICILYGFNIYPKTYYSLSGDKRSYLNLPVGTTIISVVQLYLLCSYTITAVLNEFRQVKSQIDGLIDFYPRQLNYLLRGYIILVIIFLTSSMFIPYGHGYLWITLQSVITLGGVIFPATLIMIVSPLRSYAGRKLSNAYSAALETMKKNTWFGNVYRACRRNSPTVVPII